MDDVAAASRSEWRWRLTRKDVLDATRREYCGRTSYTLGSTAYKVVCVRRERERFGRGIQEWEEVDQGTRVYENPSTIPGCPGNRT
jgi:hypothetical protein